MARSSSRAKLRGAAFWAVTEARSPAEERLETPVLTPAAPPAAAGPLSPEQTRRFREVVLAHADAAYNLALRLTRRPDVAEADCIAFSGNLEYHPNVEAVKWFRTRVWPAVRG